MDLFIIVFLFGYVCAGDYVNTDLRRIDSIRQEQDCILAGGMCVIATDCPQNNLAEQRGLCPKQQKEGIECCYGISEKESRCRRRGGECFSRMEGCKPNLIAKQATDCAYGSVCCMLVA